MKTLETLSIAPLEKALKSLQEALKTPPKNDLERDGVIQRFEYTFELCWKSIRHLLFVLGRNEVSNSPKPIFRDALEEGLIDNIQEWFESLKARNASTHIYSEWTAAEVFKIAERFPKKAEGLIQKIREKLKKA